MHKHLFPIRREREDEVDPRDYYFIGASKTLPTIVAPNYSLHIFDQGQTSTCAENAGASARMALYGKDSPILSRAFLVGAVGALEHLNPEYDGTKTIKDVCEVLLKQGICLEDEYPFVDSNMVGSPADTPAAVPAMSRVITSYDRCANLTAVKAALAIGRPVIIGIDVYASMESAKVAKTGIMSAPRGTVLGGHGVCLGAYDDTKRLVGFLNSWGSGWGDHGWGWMPYSYFTHHAYDMWSLH